MAGGRASALWAIVCLGAAFSGLQHALAQQPADDAKAVSPTSRRPFLSMKRSSAAEFSLEEVDALYYQASSVSRLAYLLLAAADPLSVANGSSPALLPALNPTLLRIYASQPSRCGSATVAELYDLAGTLTGTQRLQAAQYTLYTALRVTFGWAAEQLSLEQQTVAGQPDASAMWLSGPAAGVAAAVAAALAEEGPLAETGAAVSACCFSRATFASLVPRVSYCLKGLHADLPVLQVLVDELQDNHWGPSNGGRDGRLEGGPSSWLGGDAAEQGQEAGGRRRLQQQRHSRPLLAAQQEEGPSSSAFGTAAAGGEEAGSGGSSGQGGADSFGGVLARLVRQGSEAAAELRGRQLLANNVPSNFFYGQPPGGFSAQPPAALPDVFVPLIFHILLYRNGSTYGPPGFDSAPQYVQRLVRVANSMAKPSKFQFWVKEVRNSATAYPYLLQSSRSAWLVCGDSDDQYQRCLNIATYMMTAVSDFPRSINVFVSSDSSQLGGVLGYAWVPPSDVMPVYGYVFLAYDLLPFALSNSWSAYEEGPTVLWHELLHHLGLKHPFGVTGSGANCADDDDVSDTPSTLGSIYGTLFHSRAVDYCMRLFYGKYGGNWDALYTRMATALGIPDDDKNAWADSCPTRAGYDELGNYLTYNDAICMATIGHVTQGQVYTMHYAASYNLPTMYAWGQYYATTAPPPPPAASPPPEAYPSLCRSTTYGCACKASWTYLNTTYSYCAAATSSSILRNTLVCEVANPSSCVSCSGSGACVVSCEGSAWECGRTLAAGSTFPPANPPLPPSPPPLPPPPPPPLADKPRADCKTASNGCPCRSTWEYNGTVYHYCSSVQGSARLGCQIEPSCVDFTRDPESLISLSACSNALTMSYCWSNGTAAPAAVAKKVALGLIVGAAVVGAIVLLLVVAAVIVLVQRSSRRVVQEPAARPIYYKPPPPPTTAYYTPPPPAAVYAAYAAPLPGAANGAPPQPDGTYAAAAPPPPRYLPPVISRPLGSLAAVAPGAPPAYPPPPPPHP